MIERNVRFTLTESDVVTAMKLASSRKIFIPIPVIFAVGIGTVALAHFVFGEHTNFATNYLIPLLIFMMIMVALIQYVVLPWQARRHYSQSAALRDEVTVEWNDQGVRLSGSHGESKLAWTELHRWSESPSVILIYHSDILFHMIPKASLNEDQLEDIVGQLNSAAVKKR